jgi:phosphoglycerate dehydrogenase-like enzyme
VLPCLPVTPSTEGLIGRAQLAQMKPGAMLVNITRASVVDRAALIEALKSGRLGGFALDPLYDGPAGRSDDELLSFPNVVLSPHIAAQPRFNALSDLAELCEGVAKALA